ncbi:unnamed protein product [Laminaria digitata]
MPFSGPNQFQVHQVIASLILRAFDLEHPGSGILDTDTVSTRYMRHVYMRQSSFLAGDLRQLDPFAELSRMVTKFLADPAITSGDLDRAPTAPPASACLETAATARGLLIAADVAPRKSTNKAEGRRAVRDEDGSSWALPWGIYLWDPRRGRATDRLKLRMLVLLSKGSCQVNGKAIGRSVRVRQERAEVSKRSVLALRALRDELFPMDEPARNQVHRDVAALIMRAFDRENPGSDVEDETMVTIRTERHGYVKKTPYIAGDLRAANLNELTIMTDRFLSDPSVMSGTLEPGPDIVPYRSSTNAAAPRREAQKAKGKDGACAVAAPSAAVVTNLSGAAAVGKKRGRSKAEGCGLVYGEDGGSLPCLWGIHLESEDAGGVTTLRLKMKLGVVSVNGEECVFRKKIKIVRGVVVNAPNMAALQSLRDDFALGLGASEPVRTIVAAKAFRLWLRSRQASEISDDKRVRFSSAGAVTGGSIGRDVFLTAGVLREAHRERSKVIKELLSVAARGSSDSVECDPGSPPAGGVIAREEQGGEAGGVEGCAVLVEDAAVKSAAQACSSKRIKPMKSKRAGGNPTEPDGPTRSVIKAKSKAKDKANGKERRRRKINDDTNAGREGIEGGSPARRVVAEGKKSTPDSSAEQTKKKSKKRRRDGEPAHAAGETMRSATAEAKESKTKRTGKRGRKKRAKVATRHEGIEQDSTAAKLSEQDTCAQARQQVTPADNSSKKKRKKKRKRDERKTHAEEPRCPVEAEGHGRTGQGIIRAPAETGNAERPRLSQTPKRSTSCVAKPKQPFKSRMVRLIDWIANE